MKAGILSVIALAAIGAAGSFGAGAAGGRAEHRAKPPRDKRLDDQMLAAAEAKRARRAARNIANAKKGGAS